MESALTTELPSQLAIPNKFENSFVLIPGPCILKGLPHESDSSNHVRFGGWGNAMKLLPVDHYLAAYDKVSSSVNPNSFDYLL